MPHETMPGRGRSAAWRRPGRDNLLAFVVGIGQEDWLLPDEPFHAAGCTVVRADGFAEAADKCGETAPDLVFMPITLDGKLTTHQLRLCLSVHPAPVVVVVASNDQINAAAEAMRDGAYDCLFKPFSQTRLARTIRSAIKQLKQAPAGRPGAGRTSPAGRMDHAAAANAHVPTHSSGLARPGAPGPHTIRLARRGFVAASPQMQALLAKAAAVAQSDAPVLISGETGTGKTTLAEIVHEMSPRAAAPLVRLDCAALTAENFDREVAGPGGALDRAEGGTLFFDEVADLHPEAQSRLQRMLDIGPVGRLPANARIVAATGRDLRPALRERRFRPDLYYRLHVAPLALPRLRLREGDISIIARTRLADFSEAEGRGFVGFSDAAMARLAGYDWPGNLSELIAAIWTIVLMNEGPLVTLDLLPAEIRDGTRPVAAPGGSSRHTAPAPAAKPPATLPGDGLDGVDNLVGRTLAEIEKTVIEATIRAEGGSLPRAAKVLDVSPSTLYRKREAWTRRQDA